MKRKSFLLVLGIIAVVVGGGLLTLVLLLTHEPGFYHRAFVPPGEQRRKWSNQFIGEMAKLLPKGDFDGAIILPDATAARSSSFRFEQDQINSFFEENLSRRGDRTLPDGITEPRVIIEENLVRLAFRYGKKPWSTVISIDLKPWLTSEPNVIALGIVGLHAGAMPINAQNILERCSEIARRQEVDVSWYRYQGMPVAILRFGTGRDAANQLRSLQVENGHIKMARGAGPK